MLSKQAKEELQRMIDKGAEHMRAQGRPSYNADSCLYLDAEGNKCFIGGLIEPAMYSAELEDQSPRDIAVIYALIGSGYPLAEEIKEYLKAAQARLHDNLQSHCYFLPAFEIALQAYCNEYGLIYKAPGEPTQ
jgi:hypothetical protein